MPRDRELICRVRDIAVQIRRVRQHVNRVCGRVKFHDAQVSVTAVRHVLVVRQDLIDEVAIGAEISAIARSVLSRSAHFVPAQHQADVPVLADKFCPHRIAIVIGSQVIVLRVKTVACRYPRVVEIFIRMRDYDDLSVGIVLDHLRRPRERAIPRIKLECQHQILLTIDGHRSVEVLIAVQRIAPLPVRSAPVTRIVITRRPKIVIEIDRCRRPATRIISIVVVVSNRGEVRDMCRVELPVSRIGGRPFCRAAAVVHDVADSKHHLQVQGSGILHDPLHLGIQNGWIRR